MRLLELIYNFFSPKSSPTEIPVIPDFPASGNLPQTGLEGKQLRYLIGGFVYDFTQPNDIVEVGYDSAGIHPPHSYNPTIAYCNLFDEHNTGQYGPYLHNSDTAAEYNEGQIDPNGLGWHLNLSDQFKRRKAQGFTFVELDNPDAYEWKDIKDAILYAKSYGLKVIAKNPGLTPDPLAYISHSNVFGIIVERDAGDVQSMHNLRIKAGKPTLPIWFVSFGSGRAWANSIANNAVGLPNIGVTYSSQGEYGNSIDILKPNER